MTEELPSNKSFRELGALIETRWRAADYDEHRFPAIAEGALRDAALPGAMDPWAAVRSLSTAEPLSEQRDVDARFSDFPLTVFNGPRFYIDLYFWLDGTTEIHQHSFAGAFQVFAGASLHSRYHFAHEREINPHFLVGRVSLADAEILQLGDIRRIVPGAEFVHALFHLDRPSITLTVRTHASPRNAPQYSYWKPFFAIDPFHKDPGVAKKTQAAAILLKMKHPDAFSLIGEVISNSDFQTTFRLLETTTAITAERSMEAALGLASAKDPLADLLTIARGRHGSVVDLIEPVLVERRRQADIARRRAAITSEDHRFLLALLLNVSDRRTLLDLVAARVPEADPIETVVDWVQELGTTRALGAKENVLGIAAWDDDHVFIFECLLRGKGEDELAVEVSRQYSGDGATRLLTNCGSIARKILATPLFSAITTDEKATKA